MIGPQHRKERKEPMHANDAHLREEPATMLSGRQRSPTSCGCEERPRAMESWSPAQPQRSKIGNHPLRDWLSPHIGNLAPSRANEHPSTCNTAYMQRSAQGMSQEDDTNVTPDGRRKQSHQLSQSSMNGAGTEYISAALDPPSRTKCQSCTREYDKRKAVAR